MLRAIVNGLPVVILISVLLGGVTPYTPGVDKPHHGQPERIDSCTAITEPGRYELVRDIAGNNAGTCVQVRASNVTLDGRGFELRGRSAFDGSTGIAVSASRSLTNVTVQNVVLTQWTRGVYAENGTDVVVRDIVTAFTVDGVVLSDTTNNTVRDARLSNSVTGLSLIRTRTRRSPRRRPSGVVSKGSTSSTRAERRCRRSPRQTTRSASTSRALPALVSTTASSVRTRKSDSTSSTPKRSE
nr:NosD domain-containing protein [Halegenticoccus soli]